MERFNFAKMKSKVLLCIKVISQSFLCNYPKKKKIDRSGFGVLLRCQQLSPHMQRKISKVVRKSLGYGTFLVFHYNVQRWIGFQQRKFPSPFCCHRPDLFKQHHPQNSIVVEIIRNYVSWIKEPKIIIKNFDIGLVFSTFFFLLNSNGNNGFCFLGFVNKVYLVMIWVLTWFYSGVFFECIYIDFWLSVKNRGGNTSYDI